jgi:hypothetical protein
MATRAPGQPQGKRDGCEGKESCSADQLEPATRQDESYRLTTLHASEFGSASASTRRGLRAASGRDRREFICCYAWKGCVSLLLALQPPLVNAWRKRNTPREHYALSPFIFLSLSSN